VLRNLFAMRKIESAGTLELGNGGNGRSGKRYKRKLIPEITEAEI